MMNCVLRIFILLNVMQIGLYKLEIGCNLDCIVILRTFCDSHLCDWSSAGVGVSSVLPVLVHDGNCRLTPKLTGLILHCTCAARPFGRAVWLRCCSSSVPFCRRYFCRSASRRTFWLETAPLFGTVWWATLFGCLCPSFVFIWWLTFCEYKAVRVCPFVSLWAIC